METYLSITISVFEQYKKLAEKAVVQVLPEGMHRQYTPACNSILTIQKHVGGNLASRWTDFLTTDGEKEWRDRDAEFAGAGDSVASVNESWEKGWAALFGTLRSLRAEDLGKTVCIRGEAMPALQAIQRSLAHTCSHVGQIITLARMYAGNEWKTLSIPKGGSQKFNEEKSGR